MKKTLADKIRVYVWAHPGRTAWQIAKALKARSGSVSSFLHRAWRDGTMEAPHGGSFCVRRLTVGSTRTTYGPPGLLLCSFRPLRG